MSPAGHDGYWPERRPRLPGPSAPRPAGRRAFGTTWWGRAWVDALENRAQLDPNRLPRGRTYARSGAVGALEIGSGEVLADVQGSRRTPYEVRVRVRTFTPDEWDRVLDALSNEIGHTAALLDGELPPEVADDARAIGLDLLPGPGEVQPRCSCPDWADPCKHAAAVCYLVADTLDQNPFAVFLLRGRSRDEVLAALRARRSTVGAGTARLPEPGGDKPDAGVVAREAWNRSVAPLPTPPLPRREAGRPTVLGVDPPATAGINAAALRDLASDAARRALEFALGANQPGLELSMDEDLARRASSLLASGTGQPTGRGTSVDISDLARNAGTPARLLVRRALAWREGGTGGLAALLESWDPPPGALAVGRDLLGHGSVTRRNRVTHGDRQLRLGKDGWWYSFRRGSHGDWEPDGPPIEGSGTDDDTG